MWHALSEVFLDTELREIDYSTIADALTASGQPIDTMYKIFEKDVAPAFGLNLWQVAGEWQGWSKEEVREIVLRSMRDDRRIPWSRWLRRRMHREYVAREWAKIARYLG